MYVENNREVMKNSGLFFNKKFFLVLVFSYLFGLWLLFVFVSFFAF